MNIETMKFLSICFNTQYDATNKKVIHDTFLKIDVTALRGGLLHHVRGSELTVLLAIASFMNKDGECYPTQRQLADVTGLSLTTVNKAISNLMDVKVNGRNIIERKLRGTGQKKNSIYTIFDVAPSVEDVRDIDSVEEVVEDVESAKDLPLETEKKPLNARDFAHHFANRYKEVYGKSYVISYKRDLGLIKNKLMKNFEEDEIINIIDTCINEYPTKWANSRYPYPTLGALCGWLCNEVVKLILVNDKKAKEQEELIQAVEVYNELDYDDFMSI